MTGPNSFVPLIPLVDVGPTQAHFLPEADIGGIIGSPVSDLSAEAGEGPFRNAVQVLAFHSDDSIGRIGLAVPEFA